MPNTINENTKSDTYLVVNTALKDSYNVVSYIEKRKPYLQKLLMAEGETDISDNLESIIRLANEHKYTVYRLQRLDFLANE